MATVGPEHEPIYDAEFERAEICPDCGGVRWALLHDGRLFIGDCGMQRMMVNCTFNAPPLLKARDSGAGAGVD